MDPFTKFKSGDSPMRWSAELHSMLVDIAMREGGRRGDQKATPTDVTLETNTTIKNVSGAALNQLSVVGRGAALRVPDATDKFFFGDGVFESAAPAAGEPFAVIQNPAGMNDFVPAIFHGVTFVRVNLSDLTHEYADAITVVDPTPPVYSYLTSQSAGGQARILWKGIPANTQLDGGISDSVTTIAVDSIGNWPDPADPDFGSFVIQIEDEQMLVTATNDTTDPPEATVTRGHNGTTAASHADNTAAEFVEGVVWALVELSLLEDQYRPQVIKIINGTPSGGYYDAVLQIRDNDLASFTDGDSIWVIHLIDEPTLVAGQRFCAVFSGFENERKVYTLTDPPDASLMVRGVVNTTTQSFEGVKTFNKTVISNVAFTAMSPTLAAAATFQTDEFIMSLMLAVSFAGNNTVTGFSINAWIDPPGSSGAGTVCYFSSTQLVDDVAYGAKRPAYGIIAGDNSTGLITAESEWVGIYSDDFDMAGLIVKGGIICGGEITFDSIGGGTIDGGTW